MKKPLVRVDHDAGSGPHIAFLIRAHRDDRICVQDCVPLPGQDYPLPVEKIICGTCGGSTGPFIARWPD